VEKRILGIEDKVEGMITFKHQFKKTSNQGYSIQDL
jgi:hypothetical protein